MLTVDSIIQHIDQYDTLLIDIFGTIHNGKTFYPKALQALLKCKTLGKKIILMSNSSLPSISLLNDINLNIETYPRVYTSGDYLQYALNKQTHNLKIFFIQNQPQSWLNDIPHCTQVNNPDECDFMVLVDFPNEGMRTSASMIKDYAKSIIQYKKPIICLNSEKMEKHTDHNVHSIGALAFACSSFRGKINYIGKPERNFYQACFAKHNIDPNVNKILAIGDNMFTDIAGAAQFNIDTALITHGIYNNTRQYLQDVMRLELEPKYICLDFA